jgi:hypothetical protein
MGKRIPKDIFDRHSPPEAGRNPLSEGSPDDNLGELSQELQEVVTQAISDYLITSGRTDISAHVSLDLSVASDAEDANGPFNRNPGKRSLH